MRRTKNIINTCIIILPIAAALVGQVITRQRYAEKWKICAMAESMIVSEIYHFRANTGPYADHMRHYDEEVSAGAGGAAGAAAKRRTLFVHRVQKIFTRVMDSDVGKSGALVYGDILREDTSEGVESSFHKKLRRHVETNLIFTRAAEKKKKNRKNKKQNEAGKVAAKIDKSGAATIEPDDLISPITIETYVEFRAKAITLAYEKQTPIISDQLSVLEIATFILTSLGAVLAVPGIEKGAYVAITVALSTAVTSFIEYFQLRVERDTRNHSLNEFQNLITWWSSLSIIDKRTKQSKEKAVSTIESGILTLVERRAGAAFGGDESSEEQHQRGEMEKESGQSQAGEESQK